MNYKIVKLDGRWSYRNYFEYAIIFSNSMIRDQGPVHFATAQKYFFDAYGWSAEIRQWAEIKKYADNRSMLGVVMPDCVNPNWSWTNGYDDLRIYVQNETGLTLFTLKFSND